MYKRALVTGGAGFIGSGLARALLKEGLEVVVLDNLSIGKIENVPDGAEFVLGDVRGQEDVSKVLEGVDIIFHEAARVSIRSSVKGFYDDAETNLMGTINLLRCSVETDVRKIVFASSMAVYADCACATPIAEDYTTEPISPYGISKLASEKYCLQFSQHSGIDCHVLRYFNTYGAGQTFTPYVGVITIFINNLLKKQTPVIFGDGEQKRDFTHVSDIVSANVLSMKSDIRRGIFNVGTGISTSVNRIARLLCERLDRGIAPVYGSAQAGELRYSIADVSRATRELKYEPRFTLEDKIDEVIEYYRQQGETAVESRQSPEVT
jgi:UDP-glucose 4-epimerase